MSREFDVVVFGASGFTGQFVVEELVRSVVNEPIKWAVSGRSGHKLAQVLAIASKETGIDVKNIPIIEADVSDPQSLTAMTARTRLVLNTVGPYRFFGEQVIKACVETSTNHLDISGEPEYMERIQLKYNKIAEEKGIYIISACAWESIPCDLGVQFLKKHFNGQLDSVETYNSFKVGPKGFNINYATWQSAIRGLASIETLIDVRRRLFAETFTKIPPKHEFKLKRKILPFRSGYTNGWCLPFPSAGRSVIQRTQRFKYEALNEMPAQIETYFQVENILKLFELMGILIIFYIFMATDWGRRLLERHPKVFSFGRISRRGPTRQQINDTSFVTLIVGKGWADSDHSFPPNKTVVVRVSGGEPGYTVTSVCLVQSAMTLLKEMEKMSQKGGVLTPGAAFDSTGIYDRLIANNLNIELIF